MKRTTILFSILMLVHSDVFSFDKDELKKFRNKSSISIGLSSIKYQKAIGNYFSLGINCKYYMNSFHSGLRLDVFTRCYPLGVFEYFYLQPKFSLGYHNIYTRYTENGISYLLNDGITKYYKKVSIGGGIDCGISIPLGKEKDLFLDINLGYNFYPFPNKIPEQIEVNGDNYYLTNVIKGSPPIIGGLYDKEIGEKKWNNPIFGPGTLYSFSITFGWVF